MSNVADKDWLKTSALSKSMVSGAMGRTECLTERNGGLERSFIKNNITKQNGFGGGLPRPSNLNSLKLKDMNQLFKVPNLDTLPVKKATVKSIISPRRRVQTGRVKNDLKSNQSSKMSFLPRPSFINSRKSLHCSRSNQINARKELIKKMVFLSECGVKENHEIKESTPVKTWAGLTPRKTPRSGSYLVLPELNKKVRKIEEVKSPIQDFMRREVFASSIKPICFNEIKNENGCFHPTEENQSNFKLELKEELNSNVTIPENTAKFSQILCHCRTYNTEVKSIYENLNHLDECFESNLNDIPDYGVYNEFCNYQSKKEKLYLELQCLEEELKNFVKANTIIGSKLKDYMKRKRGLFEKQSNLHSDFEQVISTALKKLEMREEEEKNKEEKKANDEPCKLRRSLRSKVLNKAKLEEMTPMTRKLKKLDSKSKGIRKSTRVRSP